MTTMEEAWPSLLHTYRTQGDNPTRGEASCHEEARETLRSGKLRVVQMDASTFLVRDKGFNAETLRVQATRLLC